MLSMERPSDAGTEGTVFVMTQRSVPALSSIVERLPSSGIRKIFDRATALERQGHKILRFDVGRPDIETPPFIVEAAQQALADGFTKYVGNRGIPELLRAIASKLERENHVGYDSESEIVVTTGASEAVAASIFAVLEPGAEILVPEPIWPHYACCAEMIGATVVPVPLRVEDGFAISEELLERYWTPRTRMVVLSNPVNPTGKVYHRETLEQVLSFAQRRGVYVLADEMYEHFVFDGEFTSFASLSGARERTILINGFSKIFGMTGWRLGYVAAPADVTAQINKVHQYLTVCSTSFAQRGAVAAYTHPDAPAFLRRVVSDYRRRNEALLVEAARLPGLQYSAPGGAFYFFPKLPDHLPEADELALRLLDECRMAVVPGNVFGASYRRHLRISFGTSPIDEVREGLRRLSSLLQPRSLAA